MFAIESKIFIETETVMQLNSHTYLNIETILDSHTNCKMI